MRYVTQTVLGLSALYAFVAVISFLLVLGPYGYRYTGRIDGVTWGIAAICEVFVLAPYALLFAASRYSTDAVSRAVTAVLAAVAAVIGAFVYYGSFHPNDGEYGIAYVIVPLFQLPLAVAALIVSRKRRRGSAVAA